MIASDIRRILDASPARRSVVDGDGDLWIIETSPWWRLFFDWTGLEQTKLAILNAAWRSPVPLYLAPEPPIDPDLSPFVEEDGDAWRINTARPASQFYGSVPVGLGNWRLYAAPRAVTLPPPDAFRSAPAELLAYMKSQDVLLWIDCFHDDTDWCVALRDGVTPTM